MMKLVDYGNSWSAQEKRGFLWNLVDISGPSDQPPQIRDNNTSTPLLPTALGA